MDKRIKIGLIFSYNENWIAGAYYILNLIHALKLLDDKIKPYLMILSSSEKEVNQVKQIGYPYIEYKIIDKDETKITYPLIYRIINKFFRILKIKYLLYKKPKLDIYSLNLDTVFPAQDEPFFDPFNTKLFWIPDFQEHYLPHFFSEREIKIRKQQQQNLVDKQEQIVFSSNTAKQHFFQIYPSAKNKTNTLQFAVNHPDYSKLNIEELLKKYGIKRPYFFCSNQFWAHKNHIAVLKALKILKSQGENLFVVFSGKQTDYRNPDFFKKLEAFVIENQLEKNVLFLGFIDRKEQLSLMKNSTSIIQPSLFEGWSTVVEDAKAMNQHIILSNIDVHKEQIKLNTSFFDPNKPKDLAKILLEISENSPAKSTIEYHKNQYKYANDFISIINSL